MRFGQHFLISETIAEQIVSYANLSKRDIVLEIGPGRGILTELLVQKAKKVYAVEIDSKLYSELKLRFREQKNLKLINQDFLKMEIPNDVNKIVSNLPFEISSPVTEKILDFLSGDKIAVLTYQKEFADRLIAKPGSRDYSRLTVLANHMSKIEYLRDISKGKFKPVPKVDCAVVRIKSKNKKKDEKMLFVAKLLFQHKKQTVRKALLSSKSFFKKEFISDLKRRLDERIRTDKRVFQLEEDDIIEIKNRIGDMIDYRD